MVPRNYGDQLVATKDGVRVYNKANGTPISNILYQGDTPTFNTGALIGIYTGQTVRVFFRLWYKVQYVHYYQVSDTKKWSREMLSGWVKGAETTLQPIQIDLDKAYPNGSPTAPDPSGGTFNPAPPAGNEGGSGNTGEPDPAPDDPNAEKDPVAAPKTTTENNDNGGSSTTSMVWYWLIGILITVGGIIAFKTFSPTKKTKKK